MAFSPWSAETLRSGTPSRLRSGNSESMAKADPRSTQWIAQSANTTGLLAALSGGYVVGRLALGR